MKTRTLLASLSLLILNTACQAPAVTATAETAKVASSNPNACPTYDLAGTWAGLSPAQYAQAVSGTFSKSDCTMTLSYCNTTLTFSNASNPAFTPWGTVDVVVQADGSVPPTCMQPGEYRGCNTNTAYDGGGVRLWSLNCAVAGGIDRGYRKQ